MSINVYSHRIVKGYGPDLPVKQDNTLELIHGPEYSINLSFMLFYLQNIKGANNNSYLCHDIINYVLDINALITNDHDPNNNYYRLIDMTDERYILLKLHILEAIECFKTAVGGNYPISYSSFVSSNKGDYISYDILDKIIDLHFIDMPEVQDFIVYYLELVAPLLKNDKEAIKYMATHMIDKCRRPHHIFNAPVFKRMLDSLKIANISIEQFYYSTINREFDDLSYIPCITDYVSLIQIGTEYEFKLNAAEIKFINDHDDYRGRQLYLEPDFSKNLYYYKILPHIIVSNIDEWNNQKREDIATSNYIKTALITQTIAQNEDSLAKSNVIHLANFISDYF